MTKTKSRKRAEELWIPKVCVFDTETTGLDFTKDQIVTAYIGMFDTTKREIVEGKEYLIKPTIEIEAAAQKINRLDPIEVMKNGEDPKVALDDMAERLDRAMMENIPIVAMNARFDFTMLNQNLSFHGLDPFDEVYPVFDPFVIDKWRDPFRRGPRKLMNLADLYEVSYDNTVLHDAQEDALITGSVAAAMIHRLRSQNLTVMQLHRIQEKEAVKQARSLQEHFDRKMGKGKTRVEEEWPFIPNPKPPIKLEE